MEKLLDILIPVAIVIFVVGGKLFSLLKERGFDFGNLLQKPSRENEDSSPYAGTTRRTADTRDYNDDEWGNEVIVVPPPPVPIVRKASPAAPEAAYVTKIIKEAAAPATAKNAVKSAPLFQDLNSAENDEFYSAHHSRGTYYSGFIHTHGRSAIVLHEILSKPKGLE